ncbi:MAG: NAD(P)-dependent oxidoreductase, partial [Acidimicrobiales bacterium]
RERFASFATGSVFVNMGRGTVIADEADLIAALDDGPLAAAALDVTDPEPPVPGSPLYTHPAVHLTAHLAGATRVSTAAQLISENVRRIRTGEQPFPMLDRSRGY